eukprot:gnl/MRDRNA2_/MRDRNA2_93050_c0_seq1.p1 gnl/MRDRNA2_/MRDRNA2_93050_c0~~gnl/MRDRNA2_/MRDRNA2_93050_c0_seq1.p1  ORF type:complete len:395 (+),score=77.54 gnl/MRDRNA2_/MRDRNA2_93050_c0_seq1:85-1269(+)
MKVYLINIIFLVFDAKARHFRVGNVNLNASDDGITDDVDAPDSDFDDLHAIVDDPDMQDEDDDFISGLEKYAEEEDVVYLRVSNATLSNATMMTGGQAFGHFSHNSTSVADMFRSKDAASKRPRKLRGRTLWAKTWKVWYRKHKSYGGPGRPTAPMWIMKNSHIKPFAVCTPPKNGCSRWKRLLRRIQGFQDYMRDPHDWRTSGLVMAGQQPPQVQRKLWTKPGIFKMMLARNPLERLLSAWLSKKKVFKLPLHFGVFTKMLDNKKWAGANVHWKPQTFLCDSPAKGFHYDFVANVEDRDVWMPKLEEFLGIKRYTRSGWGSNGLQAFSKAESKFGSVDTGATKLKVLKKYYTPEIFRRVCRYYRNDIAVLGYKKDVKGLWKDIFEGKEGPLDY